MFSGDPCESQPASRARDDALRVLAAIHDDLGNAHAIAIQAGNPDDQLRSLAGSIRAIQSTIRDFLSETGVAGNQAN